MLRTTAVAVAVVAAALTGCSSGSSGGKVTTDPKPSAALNESPASCPEPSPTDATWPKAVPDDLPKPPGATIQSAERGEDGVYVVKFLTASSLRDAVLFVVERLPKAGYVLGRGDAEAAEADAPFVHNNIRGLYRMLQLEPCQTQWLLATVNTNAPTGNTPLLPTHSPSGSASPLPFG
jgi:hypothetical protein